MAEAVPMLALSPTMTEGTIAAWKFKEGDTVKKSAVLCEVETDKAVMDYESPAAGTLLKIVVAAGGSAAVGQLIAVIGASGEDISALVAASTRGPAQTASPAAAAPGSSVVAAPVASSPTVTAASPIPASPWTESFTASAPASPGFADSGSQPVLAPLYPRSSPLARVLARDAGIDLRAVTPSGPLGRVVKRDVEAYLAASVSPRVLPAPGAAASPATAAPAAARATKTQRSSLEDKIVPLTRMRATAAKRLGDSMREALHFFLRSAVEADRLLSLRSSLNAGRDESEKLSLNAWFVKLSAAAVGLNPAVNAIWRGDAIEYRRSVDIALAVALPEGLIAPVVRDCTNKSIAEIEAEFRVLIARAKAGALKPEDYAGATFTISNLGAWGVEEFTAIINPPGSAILALGAISKEPVVHEDASGDDEVVIRSMLRATLSCDHRTIDGAVGGSLPPRLEGIVRRAGAGAALTKMGE